MAVQVCVEAIVHLKTQMLWTVSSSVDVISHEHSNVITEWAKDLSLYGIAVYHSLILLDILVVRLYSSFSQVDGFFRGA
jgi:hypothetical protein